MVYYQNT